MPTLDWIGKEKVVNHHMDVPYRILEKKYSYGEESDNMIIHGDNLEALKSLLPKYEGRVKCIYIDPPYNTGNEGWVYNDNVNDPHIKKWLGEVVGTEDKDLSRHDKWLCMMYPRLKLLQKLLSEDGAIFISIDDNEQANLKLICDEIFGKQNFVSQLSIIVKTEGRQYGSFAKTHEYMIIYAKHLDRLSTNKIIVKNGEFKYSDKIGGYNIIGLRNRAVRIFNSTNRPNLRYPFYVDIQHPDKYGFYKVSTIPNENSVKVLPSVVDGLESVWRWGKDTAESKKDELLAQKGKDGEIRIYKKDRFLTTLPKTVWFDKELNSIVGTREISEILEKGAFDFPKPLALINNVVEIGTDEQSIVLDCFAGSGTTAHAVLNMNKQDGGNRKFILIEMMDYADSITAERVKRVIDGYGKEDKAVEGTGGGFTYYELGIPLFIDGKNLNPDAPLDKIREYIYYTETKQLVQNTEDDEYLLGEYFDTAYYFYFKKDEATTLDRRFLKGLRSNASAKVVYADICLLDDKELSSLNVTFKKIPRDIHLF